MSDIQIRPLQAGHFADYAALIGGQLGEGYLTEADFAMMAADEQAACFEAVNGKGEVVGVITSVILPRQAALKVLKVAPQNLPDYAAESERIGIFKTIAVSERAKGQGVGTALTETLMKVFRQADLSAAACVAWQYGETENIRGVMRRFGFTRFQSIPDYWKDDPQPFICPVCGEPPCHCQSNIYFKSLK